MIAAHPANGSPASHASQGCPGQRPVYAATRYIARVRRGSRALETEFAGRADYHSGSRGRVLPLKRLRQADRSRSVASPYGGRRRAAVRRRYRRDAGQDMARAYLGVRRCHMQAAALGARLLASSWARSITRRARSVSRSNMPVPPFEAPASTHDAVKIHRVCSHSQDISRARARRIPGRPRPVAVCVTTRAAAVRPAQATLGMPRERQITRISSAWNLRGRWIGLIQRDQPSSSRPRADSICSLFTVRAMAGFCAPNCGYAPRSGVR